MNESKNDRRIDYIEFRVRDIAEAKAFYGDVFGWRFKDYGPNYCEFQDGRLTGGFTTEGAPQPGGPLVVIYGDDLPALSQIIVKSGGRISKPTYDFPGGQRFHFRSQRIRACCLDREGADDDRARARQRKSQESEEDP